MSRPQGAESRVLGARLAIAAISSAGCFIGLLPATLFLANGRFVWIALLFVAGFTGYAVWQIKPTHVTPPDPLEVVAAGLGTISQGAIVSLMTLSMYITIMGAHWLVSRIAGWFHYTLPFGWVGAATLLGLVVAIGGQLAIVTIATKGVWRALFPEVAGYPTPFRAFTLTGYGQALLIGGLAVAITFTLFAFSFPLGRLGIWGCFAATYALALSTIKLWEMGAKISKPRTFTTSEEAVGAMLEAMGFRVVKQPRMGSAKLDPFLAHIDFALARPNEDRTFAMMVQETEGLGLECVSRLTAGSRALLEALKGLGGTGTTVEPALVLVGASDAEEVAEVAAQLGSHVIRVKDPAALQSESKDPDVLKAAGEALFGLLMAPATNINRFGMASANAFASTDTASGATGATA